MVTANGTFIKKTYCENCFNVIEWDNPEAEQFVSGHKLIVCPKCGNYVKIDKVEYI
jgi:NAD-dependent SIR2 family protein deacetylase